MEIKICRKMTRAGVIVKRNGDKLYFYRHGDGYPSGLGIDLLNHLNFDEFDLFDIISKCDLQSVDSIPGGIEYLYTIDLNNKIFLLDASYRY
jgi:hypothetical protein